MCSENVACNDDVCVMSEYNRIMTNVMSSGDRTALLKILRTKIAEAEAVVEEAQRRVDGLRIAYAELEAFLKSETRLPSPGSPTAGVEESAPSSSEAVRRIMSEDRRVWSIGELLDAFHERGWLTTGTNPGATLRATVHRLSKAGEIIMIERGRYQMKSGHTQDIRRDSDPIMRNTIP